MNVFLLCVVALLFLGWVYVLKLRVSDLEKKNGKLKAALKRYARERPADLHVIGEDTAAVKKRSVGAARPIAHGGESLFRFVSTVSTKGSHGP